MRPHTSYRSYRRNSARDQGTLNKWRSMNYWQKANAEARLPERAARVNHARRIAAETIVFFQKKVPHLTLPLGKAVAQALLAYYITTWKAFPGRATSRIIRDLRKAAA